MVKIHWLHMVGTACIWVPTRQYSVTSIRKAILKTRILSICKTAVLPVAAMLIKKRVQQRLSGNGFVYSSRENVLKACKKFSELRRIPVTKS